MAEINKKALEHLAELSRIDLGAKEADKFLVDLKNILSHFEELEKLDTKNIIPMTGGTSLKSVFRDDEKALPDSFIHPDKIVESFPESEHQQLKVPPVFE